MSRQLKSQPNTSQPAVDAVGCRCGRMEESSCGLGISLCACVDCSAALECCRCFEFLQMSPLLEHFVRRQGRPLQFGLIFRAPARAFLSMLVAHHLLCCLLPAGPFFLSTGLLRARQPRPRAVPRSDACARQMSAMIIVGSRFSPRAFLAFSLPILPLSSTLTSRHAAAGRRWHSSIDCSCCRARPSSLLDRGLSTPPLSL